MNEYHFGFWTPGGFPGEKKIMFGCSAHGLSDHDKFAKHNDISYVLWNKTLVGKAFSGSYQQVLEIVQGIEFVPKIFIILFNRAVGMELFIRQFNILMPGIQVVGGGAARSAGQSSGELIPQGQDVSVLAVAEGEYLVQSLNIYDKTGISVEIRRNSVREFDLLRLLPDGEWQDPAEFYRCQKKANQVDEDNFELLTFSDNYRRNVHLSPGNTSLQSGADLPDDDILHLVRTTIPDARKKLSGFMDDDNSLIFACAGVKSIVPSGIKTGRNSLAGFMFGELVTMQEKPMFGNLMLVKLIMN